MKVIEKRQGVKIACLEGIAYRNDWITEERMREIAKPMQKNQYGQYLLKVIEEMKGKPPILRIALLLIMDDKEYCGKCDAWV